MGVSSSGVASRRALTVQMAMTAFVPKGLRVPGKVQYFMKQLVTITNSEFWAALDRVLKYTGQAWTKVIGPERAMDHRPAFREVLWREQDSSHARNDGEGAITTGGPEAQDKDANKSEAKTRPGLGKGFKKRPEQKGASDEKKQRCGYNISAEARGRPRSKMQ
ncbi:hypothetical protein LX32DRAFT_648344 [Colletotrichum zoysiae]|uniref:Uncharacterized protein n=1 Tax=Colletotrichum zoysiae TaxID=1216348 RepID=A0AAD9HT57_9PEZI|nr:hypothetical protein LX32DRAFT_648344 [Colletotrichum zoysiae]